MSALAGAQQMRALTNARLLGMVLYVPVGSALRFRLAEKRVLTEHQAERKRLDGS